MSSKAKDIIFLLGAGASAEAGIPPSGRMVEELEALLTGQEREWSQYCDLYYHIKSAIYYAAGLRGRFNERVQFNIETLVNTLYELERNEKHPLYPFIASWNSRIISLARSGASDFANVVELRRLILKQLKTWVSPEDPSGGDYYHGLARLQRSLTFPLRVFSLNYDLCVERLGALDFRVETGFSGVGPRHPWDWERFEDSEVGPALPELYLYKLHGSINWKRDDAGNLIRLEQIEGIPPEKMELIFGRDFKLEAADPYLFYTYELRRYSLEASVIVSIGYGFGDSHINKILGQALKRRQETRLAVISFAPDEEAQQKKAEEVSDALTVPQSQIFVIKGSAREFLEDSESHSKLLDLISKSPDSEF